MGYIKHSAIIVTSWDEENIKKTHEKACEMFGKLVTNITEQTINGYRTFLIAPDGSKEDWEDSNNYDILRKKYKSFLKALCYGDGSSNIDYIEVWYDEQDESGIVKEVTNGQS